MDCLPPLYLQKLSGRNQPSYKLVGFFLFWFGLVFGRTAPIPIRSANSCFTVVPRTANATGNTELYLNTDLTRMVLGKQCFKITVCAVFKRPYSTKINK